MVDGNVSESVVLFLGPPGVGKSTYGRQFILEGLEAGKSCTLITTDEFPDHITSSLNRITDNRTILDNLSIIDCYSHHLGLKSTSKFSISPRNLQQMLITLQELLKTGVSRVVLDSITTLAMHNGPGVGMQFLHLVSGWLRHEGASGLFLLEAGIHDEGFMNFLRFMFDGVMEMRIFEEAGELKRSMRIFSLTGVKTRGIWVPFEISDQGIHIK